MRCTGGKMIICRVVVASGEEGIFVFVKRKQEEKRREDVGEMTGKGGGRAKWTERQKRSGERGEMESNGKAWARKVKEAEWGDVWFCCCFCQRGAEWL